MTDTVYSAEKLAELVLLFHGGDPWDLVKRTRWMEITGSREATTKVLCDYARSVRHALERRTA